MTVARNIFCRISRIGTLLLAAGALPGALQAQKFAPEEVIFPITDFKPDIKRAAPFNIKFGTGFCLDPECRFVGTNYHVAQEMGKFVRIKGVFSAHRYLDSSADDAGAREMQTAAGNAMKFAPAHDLAIYEMRRPVRHYHGAGFELEEPENDAEADIYAYPFHWNPKRGLVHWRARFAGKSPEGLLAFTYEEGRVRPGASGGIVVDSKSQKIVGVISNIGDGKERVAFAVPIKELADFVGHAQPYLQIALFPKAVFVSPVASDLYPPYEFPPKETLAEHVQEPSEVSSLRFTAQHLVESMRNFVAVETFSWGRGNHEAEFSDAYETQIIDGRQRWRRPGAKKFYSEVPFPPTPNGVIVPGGEWSELPEVVDLELRLQLHRAPDAGVGGRTIHVVQYAGKADEMACSFRHYNILMLGTTKFYDCYGEVWLDESGTILRISRTMVLVGGWRFWEVVTYGWLEKDHERHLVPITISLQTQREKTYWCRGLFTDYQMLSVKSHMFTAKK